MHSFYASCTKCKYQNVFNYKLVYLLRKPFFIFNSNNNFLSFIQLGTLPQVGTNTPKNFGLNYFK